MLLGAGFTATAVLYWWFVHSPHFEVFNAWSQQNLALLLFTLFAIKVIGIVWPPLPGGLFTLGAIPVVGWWQAYAVDLAGSMVGSTLAYGIARKWGRSFMDTIFDPITIEKMERLRVRPERELEAVFVFRLFGANVVEIICYAAGALRIRYHNFILGSVGAHVLEGIPFYYFAREFFSGKNVAFNVALVAIVVALLIVLRRRYFTTWELESPTL